MLKVIKSPKRVYLFYNGKIPLDIDVNLLLFYHFIQILEQIYLTFNFKLIDMHFRQIYPLIAVFLFNAVCLGKEFSISVSSNRSPECTLLHWRHDATNSAVEIADIEIDVFQWRVATKNKESAKCL